MEVDDNVWERIFKLRDNFILQTRNRKLYAYQRRFSNKILQSVFLNKGETIVAEYSRQSGKTTTITDTVVFILLFYFQICKKFKLPHLEFFNIGFFAPREEQARTDFDLVRDYLRLCEPLGFDFSFSEFNSTTIKIKSRLYGPREVYCFTASPTTHIESKTINLIIYEESQDLLDKQIDKAISPMGVHTNATQVFIGVAGYKRCKFWDHVEKQPAEQKVIIPYEYVINERRQRFAEDQNPIHLNYEHYIEKRKKELGDDSDEFKTQYRLIWILERGQFITYDNLMNLEKEYIIQKEYSRIETLFGGIDWGKMNDSTVFTIIDGNGRIIAWYEFLGDDYASQIENICDIIRKKYVGLRLIHCDATATQDMAVDMLKAKLYEYKLQTQVFGVKFTIMSKDEMYKNLSRLMLPTIMNEKIIEEAKFQFPKVWSKEKDKFIAQFLDLQKEIKTGGQWSCKHPDGNYHDDYCDSLALACMAFRQIVQYKPVIA